jgi:nucleotide-binding universal stress UspA family protein
MYDHILVPTDGSGPATTALEYGAELAATVDATVHVLYVNETAAADSDRERTGEEIVSDACDRVDAEGATATGDVRTGDPSDVVPAYASEHDVDVVVMGSHGRGGVGRFVLGSVTEHVVRTADVPVIVVRGDDDVRTHLPYETVVVPIDGSEHAAVALERGIDVATAFDATLHVLSVVDASPIGSEPGVGVRGDQLQAHARRIVDDAAERVERADVDVTAETRIGSIHREIASYARENEADLLVMGTHGRSGFHRFLLGSVTERVLRTAPAPVLTARTRT